MTVSCGASFVAKAGVLILGINSENTGPSQECVLTRILSLPALTPVTA